MNSNDVIRMAIKAGFAHNPKTGHIVAVDGFTEVRVTAGIERFAALVAAHEREACAAIAEMPKYLNETGILTVNPAKSAAAHFIAIAIRARGEVPR
jgi:hypothetical protein